MLYPNDATMAVVLMIALALLLLLGAAGVACGGRRRRRTPAAAGAPLLLQRRRPPPLRILARLHQTWKRRALPPEYSRNQDTWRRLNPGLEVHFYDDQDIEKFVKEHYPQYLRLYRERARPVERADLLRYMAVHRYGGFYADMDTSCLKSVEPLRHHPCVVGVEFIDDQGQTQYLQWFFGAAPGHPLMLEVLDEVQRRHDSHQWDNEHPDTQTLEVTGPRAFTAAVHRVLERDPESVVVHEAGVFGMYRMHQAPAHMQQKAYLTHHFRGEWKEHWPEHLRD